LERKANLLPPNYLSPLQGLCSPLWEPPPEGRTLTPWTPGGYAPPLSVQSAPQPSRGAWLWGSLVLAILRYFHGAPLHPKMFHFLSKSGNPSFQCKHSCAKKWSPFRHVPKRVLKIKSASASMYVNCKMGATRMVALPLDIANYVCTPDIRSDGSP